MSPQMRDRIERTWHNDVFLAMFSAFMGGLGCGLWILGFALLAVLPMWVALVNIAVSIGCFTAALLLLGRADRLRKIRWSKGDWR